MPNAKKIQSDTIALIDAAKALIDKVLPSIEFDSFTSSDRIEINGGIEFLIEILKKFVPREKIELWLTNFLIKVVPVLEISVKTILLTNLKNMISCSIDPRIPEKYRKQHRIIDDNNSAQEYGIDISIDSIDFMDKLSINPLSEDGSNWYFGLEGVDDSYKFARADDMDAFLWFVIHKGKFPNSSRISSIDEIGGESSTVLPEDGSLLSALEVMSTEDNPSKILLGNTFAYRKNAHTISMCIDRKYDDTDNIIHNTLVPVTDDWTSVNWYIRRADQLGKNLGFGWGINEMNGRTLYSGETRDFSRERAICNIQYIDHSYNYAPLTGLVDNKFRFTILPKPLIHIPNVDAGEPPWRFKKMLFNDKGEYDANGKYTLFNILDSNELTYLDSAITIDAISGRVTVNNRERVIENLIECYPGLTVFEFNYDYVMGIKLFDAKVLAHTLMETVLNFKFDIGIGIGLRHEEGTETIKEIIKNILESDDSTVNDCYYTFDSTRYDSLLRKAEEKRARQQRFGNTTHETGVFDSVNDILNEYNANADLHVQEEVLHRAITQATVIVSEGVDGKDKIKVEFNFILDLIRALVTAIVNGILSPKILMLLEVNQKIMGGTWEKFTLKDLLMALQSIIIAIVKEIRDLILQELLKLVMDELLAIMSAIPSILVREQMDSYFDAISELLRCFRIFGSTYINTTLDNVDYADIENNEGTQPSINNC